MSGLSVGKCLCVVTGASRGFGRVIAELLFQECGILHQATDGSKVILMAGATSDLQPTKHSMLKHVPNEKIISVDTLSTDFRQPELLQRSLDDLIAQVGKGFSDVIIFSNAGHIGQVSEYLSEIDDPILWQNHLNINIISPALVVSNFCKHFKESKCVVVNTSSLAAIQPLRCSSMYCVAKAAMDMYMKSLTMDCPEIRTLNYAPGPMDTDMTKTLHETSKDEGTREFFRDLCENQKFVNCVESAYKMMDLVKKNVYESGAHIDFYDNV